MRLEVSDGSYIDSFTAIQFFTVPLLPKATSFTPMAGGTGTLVTINGSTWGGSMIKSGFIGRGMHMEFAHPLFEPITTSVIREVRAAPSPS